MVPHLRKPLASFTGIHPTMSSVPQQPGNEPAPVDAAEATGQSKAGSNALVIVAADKEGLPAASLENAFDFLAEQAKAENTAVMFRVCGMVLREGRRKDEIITSLREKNAGYEAARKVRKGIRPLVVAGEVMGTLITIVGVHLLANGGHDGIGLALAFAGVTFVVASYIAGSEKDS